MVMGKPKQAFNRHPPCKEDWSTLFCLAKQVGYQDVHPFTPKTIFRWGELNCLFLLKLHYLSN